MITEIAQKHAKLLSVVTDYRKKEAEEAIKVTVVPGFANYRAAPVVKKIEKLLNNKGVSKIKSMENKKEY